MAYNMTQNISRYSEPQIEIMNGKEIVAINMVIYPIDCDEPCNATVTITWKNTSNKRIEFRPTIDVNGQKISPYGEMSIAKYQTITKTFDITGLMEGIYTVCPDPN
jgi:hypothetical protein